jgi:hypothetical protein
LNPAHAASVAAPFFDWLYRSEFPQGQGPGFGLTYTRGYSLLRELLDMNLNLALKVRVGLGTMQKGMNPSLDDPESPHKASLVRRFGGEVGRRKRGGSNF